MKNLIITLDATDGADIGALRDKIVSALIVIDGVEGFTIRDGADYDVVKTIPVFTGESLARTVRRSETGAANA